MSQATGKLKVINDTEQVSDRFKKREFVITIGEQYPQHVSFQLTQDKCELLNNYRIGDEIRVDYNLRGREWNGPQGVKYFNTLEAWRIELISSGSTTNNEGHDAQSTFNTNPAENDDLPF